MLVNLTNATSALPSANLVGGKAASLAKLYSTPGLSHDAPQAFALTVDFFRPWIDQITNSSEYAAFQAALASAGDSSNNNATIEDYSAKLKDMCHTMALSQGQRTVLANLETEMKPWASGMQLAAIRSSAPEEDGTGTSFAGAFETKLGVKPDALEDAVRSCLASLFDYRVFSYKSECHHDDTNISKEPAFAAVVMEMIDSEIAGVAFSANPLNSDRDEMVLDSSWGLGESIVDGSVHADRYVYDKIENKIIEQSIGKKTQEKRMSKSGGIDTAAVDEDRQVQSSLTNEQVSELAKLIVLVEETYGMPMDVEWAFMTSKTSPDTKSLELKLLQARPITALHCIDDFMMTNPGEPRILYYDYNIVTDATTTTPFTTMDMKLYTKMSSILMGIFDEDVIPYNNSMRLLFAASTRQYGNVSMVFKYMTPEKCSEYTKLLDHYLAAIFASKDCDHKKYRMKKLPKEVNLCNTWKLLRKIPIMTFYKLSKKYKSNPEKAKETYLEISKDGISKLEQMKERGFDVEKGLQAFADELIHAYLPAFYEEVACIMFVVVPCFNAIEKKRREGKREQIRQENDALCTGYEGDELMAMNIEMHKLASELPASIWDEYQHDDLGKLATRIKDNQEGKISDLPPEFLKEWQLFMELFDYDGQDQLFISCPRYADSPELVLAKLKQNVGATVKDPAITHQEQANKRREVMELHEQRAKKNRFLRPFALGKIKKRNEILEHLMWMRNAPKLRMAKIDGILRAEVLKVEEELLRNGRLEEAGDIFHLALSEVDTGLRDETFDLKSIVAPRKSVYQRATRATICPILVDSRCRILKPDPPVLGGDHEEGTLIGAAVSPGVARGRVRIMNNPNEKFEAGEVLAAFVTGPAWTPLFVGASAVILQIGGVLQHGALCAREYGKPAISNIDVHALLKTGDLVEVDGNTGTVRILPDCRTSLV